LVYCCILLDFLCELYYDARIHEYQTKGRPRIRWMDDVQQDLTNMGVKRCRARAVDGTECLSVMREDMIKFKRTEMLKRKQKKRNFFNAKKHVYSIFNTRYLQSESSLCICNTSNVFFHFTIKHSLIIRYVYFAITDLQFLLGHEVAQLVEALRYKPEGRGFDSRWCH